MSPDPPALSLLPLRMGRNPATTVMVRPCGLSRLLKLQLDRRPSQARTMPTRFEISLEFESENCRLAYGWSNKFHYRQTRLHLAANACSYCRTPTNNLSKMHGYMAACAHGSTRCSTLVYDHVLQC